MTILLSDEEIKAIRIEAHEDWFEGFMAWNRAIAKAQAKNILKWGEEPCTEHPNREVKAQQGSVAQGDVPLTVIRLRRQCYYCWQQLRKEIDG